MFIYEKNALIFVCDALLVIYLDLADIYKSKWATVDLYLYTFKQVGTKRDKSTVDATTDRINSLLFKVNFILLLTFWNLVSGTKFSVC